MKHYTEFNLKAEDFSLRKDRKRGLVSDDVFTFDTEATSYFINPINGNITETFDANLDDDWRKRKTGNKKCGSFYNDYEKAGVCYIWMFQVKEEVYYGRYLNELPVFIEALSEAMNHAYFTVFVQNLPYDWQYLINVIDFDEVFARQARKPMYAISKAHRVMFRDAYILNMMSLENVGKKFNLAHAKKSGELDYNLARLPCTPLTAQELEYCEYDCKCLADYIAMKAEQYGNIWKIPLTQTGEVRNIIKEEIVDASKARSSFFALKNWKSKMEKMAENDINRYRVLLSAYAGGYVHANALHTSRIIKNVWSYDFASSYPSVMITEKYPCTRFVREDPSIDNLDYDRKCYILHLVFDCENAGSSSFLSVSKCTDIHDRFNTIEDNGRISIGRGIEVYLTDCDWQIAQRAYKIENLKVLEVFSARKEYLPKPILRSIEKLYKNKSDYKARVKNWGKIEETRELTPDEKSAKTLDEATLQFNKQCLNGIYGACVMKSVTDPVEYDYTRDDSGWVPYDCPDNMTLEEWATLCEIDAQNILTDSNSRLLFNFGWGVWVSAYARRNLWEAVLEIGDGTVYCDTDSIKGLPEKAEEAAAFVRGYNDRVDEKVRKSCEANGLDVETLLGIGRFDYEGTYDRFVTLGSKKYAYEKHGRLEITVSGVDKRRAVYDATEHAEKLDRLTSLKEFKNGKCWGAQTSGRLIRYYIDNQQPRTFVDYLGNSEVIDQKHAVCLQPSSYVLGVTDDYAALFAGIQEEYGRIHTATGLHVDY